MIVRTATSHFFSDILRVYPDAKVLSEKDAGREFDLLIFTGGGDVNPRRYGEENTASFPDDERDEIEFNILREVGDTIHPKKVLGLCRGLQVINVFLGGTLFQDISHPNYHNCSWVSGTVFSKIKAVNSYHHQSVRNVGRNDSSNIICTGPNHIIEGVYWNKFLGVQWHPEFLGDDAYVKQVFFNGVNTWVETGSIYLPERRAKKSINEGKLKFSGTYSSAPSIAIGNFASSVAQALPFGNLQELPDEEDSPVE